MRCKKGKDKDKKMHGGESKNKGKLRRELPCSNSNRKIMIMGTITTMTMGMVTMTTMGMVDNKSSNTTNRLIPSITRINSTNR